NAFGSTSSSRIPGDRRLPGLPGRRRSVRVNVLVLETFDPPSFPQEYDVFPVIHNSTTGFLSSTSFPTRGTLHRVERLPEIPQGRPHLRATGGAGTQIGRPAHQGERVPTGP